MSLVAAIVDCEAIQAGWPHQPVNAWSSLAFVVAGGVIAIGSRNVAARLIGAAAALVGIGSVLFHGDHNDFSGWLHDWSIAALLLILVLFAGNLMIRARALVIILGSVAGLLALAPGSGEWVHGGIAVAFVVRELRARRERLQPTMSIAVALIVGGALLTIFGRTGGPLCVPDSTFQPHSGWHVLAAAALGVYAASRGFLDAFDTARG